MSCCLQNGRGKIAVLGSAHMLSDQYFDKEENSKIMVSRLRIQHMNRVAYEIVLRLLKASVYWVEYKLCSQVFL